MLKAFNTKSQDEKLPFLFLFFIALLTLLPFICFRRQFHKLFWFGDELDLLSQLRHHTFWDWLFIPFAESFVPLFKLLWGGATILFSGSYFAMEIIVWLTHALNAFLLGVILLEAGLGIFIAVLSMLTFGLAWSNIETLGWSVQWSAILSITFFLIGILFLQRKIKSDIIVSKFQFLLYGLVLFASTLSFARGILSCLVLFLLSVMYYIAFKESKSKATKFAIIALLPALFVTIIIFLTAGGNHQKVLSLDIKIVFLMFQYATHVFFLNPMYHLFTLPGESSLYIYSLGALKTLVITASFFVTKSTRGRLILGALFFFDLGNACLLGLARYHEGLAAAVSWRYQYVSLIASFPFFVVTLNWIFDNLFHSKSIRHATSMVLISLWVYQIASPWHERLEDWSGWRGKHGRRALLRDDPAYRNWLGITSMVSFDEAKATVKEFNLH